MEFFITNFIGFIIGVIASFVCWWILFHVLVPKVKFSDKISLLPSSIDSQLKRYRVKLQNVGRRNIIDAEFKIKLRIRGLIPDRINTWKVFYVETSDPSPIIYITKKNTENTFGGLVLYLNIHKNKKLDLKYLPKEIVEKFNSGLLTMKLSKVFFPRHRSFEGGCRRKLNSVSQANA